jgi:hypothetical protein
LATSPDCKPCAEVLSAFMSALARSLKHRAKKQLSLKSVDEALRLNLHFHVLAPDGVSLRSLQHGIAVDGALPEPALRELIRGRVEQVHQLDRRASRRRGVPEPLRKSRRA